MGRGCLCSEGRIIPTTDATANSRRGYEDYREIPDQGEVIPPSHLKAETKGIIGKIKGIWFPWKE